jgi:type I restriction enzyme M protein
MNLAIRGINGDIRWGDSFSNDLHSDLKADFILANPPFNVKDWKGDQLQQDNRWKYGIPPVRNANFAWIQHFIHHLSPSGVAAFILTNGSLSSTTSNEGNIRKNIVETNLIDCIVTLPDRLFYNTSIPACLWIINQGKQNNMNRREEVLFIDARDFGVLFDRVHRQLSGNDIKRISMTYHSWKSRSDEYRDILGYCKSVVITQIRENKYILTPARYIGISKTETKDVPFTKKMDQLLAELTEQFKQSEELMETIKENLGDMGFDL